MRAKEEETDIENETQRRNKEGNGDGEKIGEGKLQREREAENRAKEGKRGGFLEKSQNSFGDAWANLGKGLAGDAVSKWEEAKEEMANLPAFLLLASRSLSLAPLTPPKLAKPAVCQASPNRNTYCFPIAKEAGERILEKGFESYKRPARLTRDNLREGSRKEKGHTSARTKELRQTSRQRD